MRHISIKVRMTIWFTVLMVTISTLMLVFVMLMNRNQVTKPPAAQVVSVAERNADRVEVEHGQLDLSDVDLFRHGVYTQVYDGEGCLLAGSPPPEMTEDPPLAEGPVRQVQGTDGLYDVYDVSIPAAGVWVRGVISHTAQGGVMEVIVPLAWTLLPALIVVSALGGFLIAWLSFRPMEKVISTAEAICPAASACPGAAARSPVWLPPSTACATGWSAPSRRSGNLHPTRPMSCARRWR